MANVAAEQDESKRVLFVGRPDLNLCDNRVSTAKYTVLTFLPIAIREQFRRNGNIYFLVIGTLMAVGYYTDVFSTAISPWTTLGPLAVVVAISLTQEGAADLARHRSDSRTNQHPCVVLKRSDDLNEAGGERDDKIFDGEDLIVRLKRSYAKATETYESDVTSGREESIAFERVKRMNIRAGNLVLVRNRDMVPADLILLASSGDSGNAYIETSSIDGETNLKLRTSPPIARSRLDLESVRELDVDGSPEDRAPLIETLEQAAKRITRLSVLGNPDGESALENPVNPEEDDDGELRGSFRGSLPRRASAALQHMLSRARNLASSHPDLGGQGHPENTGYVAVVTSEPPNASVNTYSGKLTLPPVDEGKPSRNVALGAENILLRGAILRNTEWAIGLACFTGKDTKLVMNSFETPSKFSGLDEAINRTVFLILFVMILCVVFLAGLSVDSYQSNYDHLWYAGYNNAGAPWPYLPEGFAAPDWDENPPIYGQQVFLFITLLNNFVPLSLYVTVEIITLAMMLWIGLDKDMYHEETDTHAVARSTIVTDLGQVRYIFSDKTGTLTQNVMRFKRCSVDGMAFGAPVEKASPVSAEEEPVGENIASGDEDNAAGVTPQSFHPLRQLLLGAVDIPREGGDVALDGQVGTKTPRKRLTFNAEMFLRVMSICHTVVVEKDFDASMQKDDESVGSKSSTFASALAKTFQKKIKGKRSGQPTDPKLVAVSESGALTDLVSPVSHLSHNNVSNIGDDDGFSSRERSEDKGKAWSMGRSADGAPTGHNYQAESPDEGALVSAASLTYDFQFLGRDSSGVQLACSSPSLLADRSIVDRLKDGSLTPRALSAASASPILTRSGEAETAVAESNSARKNQENVGVTPDGSVHRRETWAVLAVNKFDSDRKRMSVLVRSPPELGSLPMLLCKGADSAMLDDKVCNAGKHLMPTGDEDELSAGELEVYSQPQALHDENDLLASVAEELGESGQELVFVKKKEEDDWEMAAMLGIQAHLGDFASEGLRTLVLGVRILQEDECETWLQSYKAAATSIKDRESKLTEVALSIERNLHIVGATAIEDKLQDGVPDTIATLEDAGIKLWVLTGDKRETAIEIGYSTKVLTPKMRLMEVADNPVNRVRTLMAMEFIRLVKCGKLVDYQHSVLGAPPRIFLSPLKWKRSVGQCWRAFRRFRLMLKIQWRRLRCLLCCKRHNRDAEQADSELMESIKDDPVVRRKAVRDLADKIIQEYLESEEGRHERVRKRSRSTSIQGSPRREHEKMFNNEALQKGDEDGTKLTNSEEEENLSLSSDILPAVFNRAQTARAMLDSQRISGQLASSTLRALSIASVTTRQSVPMGIVDEDMLSLASFLPDGGAVTNGDFDKKKRTILEKLFAVDRYVRHGNLGKHLNDEKLSQLSNGGGAEFTKEDKIDIATDDAQTRGLNVIREVGVHGPRALVIEGAALVHLLGDSELEEMLFAVASACDAVIACRVSPKQKALLVRLVRKYVSPTPVTLAIGDGANDVGMIQEAHVGVGISGLEGQQAVNASDFAIAQFRFLRDLLLIHGRWNFIRLCKVTLYSFYKNAVMAGTMIVFQSRCLYSGTPLYDQWVISMLNFVASFPILFTGFFDRDLEKDYVRRNPIVYTSGPNNENITLRITLRWILLTIIHVFTIYELSGPALANGGGVTSAFVGLMSNNDPDTPGDGEGGDLKVFGTTIYTVLIFTLAYKVLFETRSLVHGVWPAFTCRKGVGEGWPNRLAYTWIGVWWLSIGFYLFAVYTYQLVGRNGASTFSPFTLVAIHTFNTRSITWMTVILVPTAACVFDVTGKVFSNMHYPTQTQIHMEIQAKEVAEAKLKQKNGSLEEPYPTLAVFSHSIREVAVSSSVEAV